MIEITNLTKIYKSEKKKLCRALDNVNLTFPDTGLVFVLGKSGSGKSTLLNLIGGLDSITSGKIVVDGNDLSRFSERTFCDYRNTHVGFIFQDYHLIDELTVYENIVLSLNLRRFRDEENVKQALEKVGLAGYGERYPSELSGGERQRVAIARALVKKPRIILADEPTGNLDTNTATAIIEILKSLSKECLILVVSHNVNDTYRFADRIVELAGGRVIGDHTRNPDFREAVTIASDTLVYPAGKELSDADISLINSNTGKKLVKRTDQFLQTVSPSQNTEKRAVERKSLSFLKQMQLSGKFLKNKTVTILLSALMVSVIMVILSLAQTILDFDTGGLVAGEMEKKGEQVLFLRKGIAAEKQVLLDRDYCAVLGDEDLAAFRSSGYQGDVYPVYNVTIPVSTYLNRAGYETSNLNSKGYMTESFGTLVVDESFLIEKFGKIRYLARSEIYDPAGVIITDYVADSILLLNEAYKGKTYADIIGAYAFPGAKQVNVTVNAIIQTGYGERYADLLQKISSGELKKASDLYKNEDYLLFLEEIYASLGFCYSLSPNFAECYQNDAFQRGTVSVQKIMINGSLQYAEEGVSRYFTSLKMLDDEALARDFYYVNQIPQIPSEAKYMCIGFAVSYETIESPAYQALPIAEGNCARVLFSNGEDYYNELRANHGMLLMEGGAKTYLLGGQHVSFVSDLIPIPEGETITEFYTATVEGGAYCTFYDESQTCIYSCVAGTFPLPEKSMMMNVEEYNRLFGTQYTEKSLTTFVPHTVTLTQYRLFDAECEAPLWEETVEIVGLCAGGSGVSVDLFEKISQNDIYQIGVYLDGIEGAADAIRTADRLDFEHQSVSFESIYTMTKAVDVFVPIFRLIAMVLCVGIVFILVNFSSKMIKDKLHGIGILKALGAKNGMIVIVFGLQVLLIAILTCVFSTVGYFFFIDIANDVLFDSLKSLTSARVIPELTLLRFRLEVALMNCGCVLLLALLSLVAPMIKIKRIKPIKIVKTRD